MYITPKIKRAKILDEYKIELLYETGELKIYDMTELINTCEFYKNLKDKKEFEKITIVGLSVQWQNGEDIAPELLYNDSILQKIIK